MGVRVGVCVCVLGGVGWNESSAPSFPFTQLMSSEGAVGMGRGCVWGVGVEGVGVGGGGGKRGRGHRLRAV